MSVVRRGVTAVARLASKAPYGTGQKTCSACMKSLVFVLAICTVAAFGATLPGRYIVQLSGEPANSYAGSEARHARANALLRQHARLRESIQQQGAEVTGETSTVVNTLFVRVPQGSGADLESLPGVSRVY